jgi:hypothetical protein
VLVDVGEEDQPPRYWIVPARAAQKLIVSRQLRTKDVEQYRDAWGLLDQQ